MTLQPDTKLWPYQILAPIGAGGMGVVHEAEDVRLGMDPNFIPAHLTLGDAYLQKSKYKDGIAKFEKVSAISPGDAGALSGLGRANAVAGRKAEAQKVLDELNEISKPKYVPAVARIGIYVGLGEKDKAFERLETAYEDRSIGSSFANITSGHRRGLPLAPVLFGAFLPASSHLWAMGLQPLGSNFWVGILSPPHEFYLCVENRPRPRRAEKLRVLPPDCKGPIAQTVA